MQQDLRDQVFRKKQEEDSRVIQERDSEQDGIESSQGEDDHYENESFLHQFKDDSEQSDHSDYVEIGHDKPTQSGNNGRRENLLQGIEDMLRRNQGFEGKAKHD